MSKVKNIAEKAEQKARQRESEQKKVLTDEELKQANDLQSKASERGMKLVPERRVKNRDKFTQFIQDNWNYILETNYLTDEEILFLVRIQRFMQFKSNCLVDDIHSKSPIPLSQKQVAERLKTDKSKVSRLVNSLADKGVIVKAKGHKIKGNNVRTHALFINPNIIYSGERDNIETTLKTLFANSKSLLKDFPVALF